MGKPVSQRARHGQQHKKIDPKVYATLQPVLAEVRYEEGHITWGPTEVATRVLVPVMGATLAPSESGILSITCFPAPAGQLMAAAERMTAAADRAVQNAQRKGKEVPPALATQAQIARHIAEISREGGVWGAQAVAMATDENIEPMLQDLMSTGKWRSPKQGWIVGLAGALPTASPVPYTDSRVFFALTNDLAGRWISIPPRPSPLPATDKITFYFGISTAGGLVCWQPWGGATNPHLAITGYSGSGKSALSRLLVFQILLLDESANVPLVVVDPKGEWPGQFKNLPKTISPEDIQIVSDPYQYALPSPSKLVDMAIGENATPPLRAEHLASILSGFEMPDAVGAAVNSAMSASKWEDLTWGDIYRHAPEGAKQRMSILDPDGAWSIFHGKGKELDLSKRVTVIGLPTTSTTTTGSSVFITLLILALTERLKRQGRRTMILVDEAHILLRIKAAREAVVTLGRVARSAGMSVVLASQWLEDLYAHKQEDVSLAGQCATRIVLCPSPSGEINRLEEFGLADYKEPLEVILSSGTPGLGIFINDKGGVPFRCIVPRMARDFAFASSGE